MEDLLNDLQSAFEREGYALEDVSHNRTQVRIVLQETGLAAEDLRATVTEIAGDDATLGINVTTESIEGQDDMRTVVTFRHRP